MFFNELTHMDHLMQTTDAHTRRNPFMRFITSLLLLFICTLFIACSSPKERFLRDFTAFTEETVANYHAYTPGERDLALEQYAAFRDEKVRYEYEFTPAEQQLVSDCVRRLNALIAKEGIRKIDGYINEVRDLIEDIFSE